MVVKKLGNNAEAILSQRYYLGGEDWVSLCKRVVSNVVPPSCRLYSYSDQEVEVLAGKCFDMINSLYFLPNSPTLFNAGTKTPMLSACFVIDVEDDLSSIFDSVRRAALIHKMGGGVGLSFGKLRARGSKVSTTHGASSGSVSFIKAFANATICVTAGGRRHGANMGQLPIHHADILEFLSCKQKEGELSNFNLSVQITDEFIKAVKEGKPFDLIDPKDGSISSTLEAKELMALIVEGAWRNGEPGVCFIDTVNKDNPTPHLGRITSSNPCGEYYSIPYGSCNLGSLNLTKYIEKGSFNWGLFKEHIYLSTFYLDCVVDANKYPLSEIEEFTLKTRPLGLGVMGLADCLILQNIRYGSEESLDFCRKAAEFLSYYSLEASSSLVEKRGTYSEFKPENHTYSKQAESGGLKWDKLCSRIQKEGLRNSHTCLVAPTGTLARLADVSFGIEPLLSLNFESHILDGNTQKTEHKLYKDFLSGSLKVDESVFITANKLSWKEHIDIQAAWQKFLHNGVSKTINFPNSTTKEEVYEALLYAYESGLKGITVYREGSRKDEAIVSLDRMSNRVSQEDTKKFSHHQPVKRPDTLPCDIHHTQVQTERWVVFVGLLDGIPYEVFGGLSKYVDLPKKYEKGHIVRRAYKTKNNEYDLIINKDTEDEIRLRNIVDMFENPNHGVLSRLISLALRQGAKPAYLSEQLFKDSEYDFTSYNKVIGRILKRYICDGEEPENGNRGCPECGNKLVYREGCKGCVSCSWSKCD